MVDYKSWLLQFHFSHVDRLDFKYIYEDMPKNEHVFVKVEFANYLPLYGIYFTNGQFLWTLLFTKNSVELQKYKKNCFHEEKKHC